MFFGPVEDIQSVSGGPASRPLSAAADTLKTARLMLLARTPGVEAYDAGNFAMPAGMVQRDEQLFVSGDARQRRVFIQRLPAFVPVGPGK